MTQLKNFSKNYWLAEMEVQPYKEGPVIERGLYDIIDSKIYKRTDAPITMTLGFSGGPTFEPQAESAVPTDVLALPQEMMDQVDVKASEKVTVFIYKPRAAYLYNREVVPDERRHKLDKGGE